MPRYVTRAGWVPLIEPDDHDAIGESLTPDLNVPGPHEPRSTGLFDLAGNELFRLPEPLGFHHPKD
jgi:hypothetical protein